MLSTEDYKAMRNKSSATSSSSSSQATVLSAGSAATSNTATSSDDSDDLISYKSSTSTNELLAQSQAMTTSQLMSKYLKREPRVQFTPMKSPDSPSPPDTNAIAKGSYQFTKSANGVKSSANESTAESTGKRLFDSLAAEQQEGGGGGGAAAVNKYNDIKNVVNYNKQQQNTSSDQTRSLGSSLFSGNGSNATQQLYGTLPKNGNGSTHGSSAAIDGAGLFGLSTSTASTASSINSYDLYNNTNSSVYANSTTRSSNSNSNANGNNGSSSIYGNGGSGNYHTLGTYRVQYAATNPFLDAFDTTTSTGTGTALTGNNSSGLNGVSSNNYATTNHRVPLAAAFPTNDSKNGSDEYEDLK